MCDFDTMSSNLYHKEIGLPKGATNPWCDLPIRLVYSEHAKQAASNDRYGAVPLYGEIEFAPAEIIEVEYVDRKPVKAVCRIPSEDYSHLDIVLVLNAPDLGQNAIVRTVWYNRRNDNHRTLNRHLYKKP